MNTEYEARVININIDNIIKKCNDLGAKFNGCYLQKRYVYDFKPPLKGKWIRLRCNGKKTTLTIKMINSVKIDGTKEVEIEVSDFELTNEILKELGYKYRSYQENFRIEFIMDNTILDIDKWPGLNPYIEIESVNEEAIHNSLKKLGYKQEDLTSVGVDSIYRETGINLDKIISLRLNDEELKLFDKIKMEMKNMNDNILKVEFTEYEDSDIISFINILEREGFEIAKPQLKENEMGIDYALLSIIIPAAIAISKKLTDILIAWLPTRNVEIILKNEKTQKELIYKSQKGKIPTKEELDNFKSFLR